MTTHQPPDWTPPTKDLPHAPPPIVNLVAEKPRCPAATADGSCRWPLSAGPCPWHLDAGHLDADRRADALDAVWIARYPDCSALAAFATEIDALRHAVKHSMEVVRVPWGEDIRAYQPGRTTR
jgi:hypothetical protein